MIAVGPADAVQMILVIAIAAAVCCSYGIINGMVNIYFI